MKSFFDKAILLINELITIRNNQITIYNELGNTKEATGLLFKIKNYKKWIEILKDHIKLNTSFKTINDIKEIKFTPKLELKLIELFETDNIKDIDDAKVELKTLEAKLADTPSSSPSSSSASAPASAPSSTEFQKSPDTSGSVDTSKIESQPKQLIDKKRPKDKKGGDIYDLLYVHEIGEVNAKKLVEDGVTLNGLLEEWDKWSLSNPENSVLLTSKMQKPNEYSTTQWKSLDDEQKDKVQKSILVKKLNTETKLLKKIHFASLISIKHFHNMSLKIPREEIDKANTILQKIGKHMNKDIKVVLCGSYRRGRDKSGDIDCLILHPDIKTQDDLDNSNANILANFVKLLIDTNFIVDQLSMGIKKFMGFCIVPKAKSSKEVPVSRRIDIRFVPYNSFGSALIYFTGSKNFNTTIRTIALNKGYSLSEFGFKSKKDNSLITFATEEEVFKFLDYPYKTPKERDI